MRINSVFAVDAPLLRLLCLSLIKFKEPLKMNYILAGFLHLSKVFDTVDHNIFLAKLDQYGIRGSPKNCFRSYLTNKQQTNSDSNLLQITYGVPEGSVLGPLLPLIYINEFINSSSIFDFPFLDDDSNLQFLLQQQKLESPLLYSVTVCSVCRCT